MTRCAFRGLIVRDAFKECIGLVSLVEDEIRDEKRTDHTLRLAARVVRPNYSWTNGRLEMVEKDWRRRSSKPSE